MEITSQNYLHKFAQIKAALLAADFVAIDTEFSGYSQSIEDKSHPYDTQQERYAKLKHVCESFVCFQVGICTFRLREGKYVADQFSFYTFPQSQLQDHTMLFQADAINFLGRNNFNFNTLMSKAIKFHPYTQTHQLLQKCHDKVNNQSSTERSFTSLSQKNQHMLDQMMGQIHNFVHDPSSGNKLIFHLDSYSLQKGLSKLVTMKYMNTGVFTEFQRGLSETVIKKSKSFKQSNFYQQSQDDQIENLGERAFELCDSELGFSQVVQVLVESQKPVVGHNMIYDIGFIYNQFIAPLPETYSEFQTQISKCFPQMYDTKVLSVQVKLQKTDLWYLFNKVKGDVNIDLPLSKQEHDAGYDAFMTGVIFASLSNKVDLNFARGKVMKNIGTQEYYLFDGSSEVPFVPKDAFQVETTLGRDQVVHLFRQFGDLIVTQTSKGLYWIEYEEYEQGYDYETVTNVSEEGVIVRRWAEAKRFPYN